MITRFFRHKSSFLGMAKTSYYIEFSTGKCKISVSVHKGTRGDTQMVYPVRQENLDWYRRSEK